MFGLLGPWLRFTRVARAAIILFVRVKWHYCRRPTDFLFNWGACRYTDGPIQARR